MMSREQPNTGACIAIVSKAGGEIIDANDKKDTVFMLINWPRGKKLA